MDTTLQVPSSVNTVSRDRVLTGLLVLIAIALIVLIGLTGYSIFKQQEAIETAALWDQQLLEESEQARTALERIAESVEATQARNEALDRKYKLISGVVSDRSRLINGLVDSYQADAYENPSLERITEQQLIAAEYQLTALQIMALQNDEIIQLLTVTP